FNGTKESQPEARACLPLNTVAKSTFERESERGWRRDGVSQGTKADATISGWTSASACLAAVSPRTALSSAKTTSSAFTTPKSSNEEIGSTRRSSANCEQLHGIPKMVKRVLTNIIISSSHNWSFS
ncbi:hypothetical protein F2P56_024853, partial [Juglans regia]